MNLQVDEIIEFSQYCKTKNFNLIPTRISSVISLNSSKKSTVQKDLQMMYLLLPTSKEEKEKLKVLIESYFKINLNNDTYNSVNLNEYLDNDLNKFFDEDSENNIAELSESIIESFGEIDFSRPVSNNYWLSQLRNSESYKKMILQFNLNFANKLDEIINDQNLKDFQSKLDKNLLEMVTELRNQFKDAYLPSELSSKEDLEEKDFLYTDNDERNKLLKATKVLGALFANRFIRHIKNSNKGNLNFRRTIRKSLKHGGILLDIIKKPKLRKKPRLVLFCDISGSMALYSLFGLTLLYGIVQKFSSVKCFVFIDGATDITSKIKNLGKNNVQEILNSWNEFVFSDGHSDYSKSFEMLVNDKSITTANSNTLIVIGDARNNYRTIDQDLINRISNKFNNIYWMNPERKQYWNTGDSQFFKFEEIITKYEEVRNLNQLNRFINKIKFNKVLKT